MKRIKPNSYYIDTHTYNNNTKYILHHYIDVWRDDLDRFSIDEFVIDYGGICFEDAIWCGVAAVERETYVPISANEYNRWRDMINNTKERIISLGLNNSQPLLRKPIAGDYLFVCEEADPEYDYYYYEFNKILEVDDESYKTESLIASKYELMSHKRKVRFRGEDDEIEMINQSQLIDKQVYIQAANIIKDVSAMLIDEIKKSFNRDPAGLNHL